MPAVLPARCRPPLRAGPGLGFEADIRFTDGSPWDRASYEPPLHLTDPRALVVHALLACSDDGEEPGDLEITKLVVS